MKKGLAILVFILALVYILSPVDILPDGFPVLGWIDDIIIAWIAAYYFSHGRLPPVIQRLFSSGKKQENLRSGKGKSGSEDRESPADGHGEPGDPWEVLGVSRGAGPEEIRAAYQRAVKQYHPDRAAHLGPELRRLAHEKFVRIQEAYEKLRTG